MAENRTNTTTIIVALIGLIGVLAVPVLNYMLPKSDQAGNVKTELVPATNPEARNQNTTVESSKKKSNIDKGYSRNKTTGAAAAHVQPAIEPGLYKYAGTNWKKLYPDGIIERGDRYTGTIDIANITSATMSFEFKAHIPGAQGYPMSMEHYIYTKGLNLSFSNATASLVDDNSKEFTITAEPGKLTLRKLKDGSEYYFVK